MDFHGLIYEAHKNEVTKDKTKPRLYPSSFAPPKKEEKSKGLSVNVKKFLARKEEEEKQRKIEEEMKREKLLQLRNQDNKAKKRVQVMLKRTKSYNKSVLEDAIDKVNTADTMNGPQQCDEDDYGYVSQEASAFYSKMMDKYGSVRSEDNKYSKKGKTSSSDLHSTKDRVKMALQRQEEEEMMPHKRKRKKKEDDGKTDNEPDDEPRHSSDKNHSKDRDREERDREEKPKPKRAAAPPPMDFSELLKMAEKKQYEPPPLELKLKEVKRQQQKEPERLMTKKEKLEYEKARDKRSGASTDTKRENSKAESNRGREDERKKGKEQKGREDDRNRREREQEKRRQEDRELERRRQEDREAERRRQEDKERQREKERIRELEEELARRKEKERLREEELERRERERKLAPVPKKTEGRPASKPSSSSSSKPRETTGKSLSNTRPSNDKDKGTSTKKSVGAKLNSLFGDRDSASPERTSKTEKPKPRPVERIKINNSASASLDDLFGDDVTIRTKQKPVPNSNSNKVPAKSNDKSPMSSKPTQPGSKLGRDDVRKDKGNVDRKRPADTNGRDYPDKKPRPGDPRPAPNGKQPARKEFPPKDLKSRQFPPPDVRSRQFPPADVRSRQFPPADMRSRQFPPSDVSRRGGPANSRRLEYERADSDSSVEDEDDEYDSELDDFIDDGPLEDEPNVSSVIREIFGYDKSRYANIDDDDECMESNYAQVMQEEKKSLLIGMKEDEIERLEEERHKRQKAMRKLKESRR